MHESIGLPPLAWLSSRSYSRLVRTMAEGGDGAIEIEKRYENVQKVIYNGFHTDRNNLLKAIVSLEITRERGLESQNDLNVASEVRLVQPIYHFLKYGRQVFEFDNDLIQELKRTDVSDVSDVSPNDIQTPYDAFYLRLPGALPPVGDIEIDGIIIQQRDYEDAGPSLVLDFMPVHRTPLETAAVLRHMPTVMIPLKGKKAIEGEIGQLNWTLGGYLPKAAGKFGLNKDNDPMFDIKVEDVLRRYKIGESYVTENLPLIINTLLFIDNCRTEQTSGWSHDAPTDLVSKAEGHGPGSRKAEQKLIQSGWTKVTLCQVEQNGQESISNTDDRVSVRAHWRRGHWRRQHYGPKLINSKMIRIRPMMVGTGKAIEGRTYRGRLNAENSTGETP